jgi:uncharacterized membrane protein
MTERRRRREHGGILPLAALSITVCILFASFAIDVGSVLATRREMQAHADVVALDLIRLADGDTEDAIVLSSEYTDTLNRSAANNGFDLSDITVAWGEWTPGGGFVDTASTDVPTAVQVTSTTYIDYFFRASGQTTTRRAVATRNPIAVLGLGSRLLALQSSNSARLDWLLCTLLQGDPDQDGDGQANSVDTDDDGDGTPDTTDLTPHSCGITFGAATYNGLATASVSLQDLVDAQATFTSVDELLAADLTVAEYSALMATALTNNGNPTAASFFNTISASASGFGTISIGDLVQASIPTSAAAGAADINAFDLLIGGLQLANSQSGIASCVSNPGTLATQSTDICSTVVNAEKIGIGNVGDTQVSYVSNGGTFETAQVTVSIVAKQAGVNLNLGGGLLGSVTGTISVPISLSGGGAEGNLEVVDCDDANPANSTVDVMVGSRPLTGTIGRSTPSFTLSLKPPLTSAVTINVTINKSLSPSSAADQLIDDLLVGQSAAGPGAAPSLGLTVDPSDLVITSSPSLPAATVTALQAALDPLVDAALLSTDLLLAPRLNNLGVGLSSSDLTNHDVDCSVPALSE